MLLIRLRGQRRPDFFGSNESLLREELFIPALQQDKYVTTHSEGEEPYRHVVVTIKR